MDDTPPRMIAYSQSKSVMNNAEVFIKQEDTKNNTQKSAQTENKIRTKFEKLFQKYGIEYSMETLLNLIGDSVTKEQLLDSPDSLLDSYVVTIEQAFEITQKDSEKLDATNAIRQQYEKNNRAIDINNLSRDEKKRYIKEYFEENYAKYLEAANNDPQLAKKMLFGAMLSKTSEKDKYLLLPIMNEVMQDPKVLTVFFDSIKDNKIKKECADTLTYDEWKNLQTEEEKVIYIQNMSSEGTNIIKVGFKQEVIDFYNKYGKQLIVLEEKAKSDISELTLEEQELLKKRNSLTGQAPLISAGMASNKNITAEERKSDITEITKLAQEYGFEDEYLTQFANIIKSNQFDLQISKDEIKEIVDTVTSGKFSEKYNSIPEKSATDEKTGGFKTNPDAAAIASLKKDEQQTTILNNNPIENNTFIIETTETNIEANAEENGSKTESFVEKYGQNFAFKLFTGKIKTFSSLEESLAINNYKLMNVAQQGKLLQTSVGKFFNKLIDNTKTYTLENLLASGWKGQTFNITQQVEDTVEERNEKLNSLPS